MSDRFVPGGIYQRALTQAFMSDKSAARFLQRTQTRDQCKRTPGFYMGRWMKEALLRERADSDSQHGASASRARKKVERIRREMPAIVRRQDERQQDD